MQKIKNFLKNLKELIKNRLPRIVIKTPLTILWVCGIYPIILYIIFGVVERPVLLEDFVAFMIYRVISIIFVQLIIDKWLLPKILDDQLFESRYLILYLLCKILCLCLLCKYLFIYNSFLCWVI